MVHLVRERNMDPSLEEGGGRFPAPRARISGTFVLRDVFSADQAGDRSGMLAVMVS